MVATRPNLQEVLTQATLQLAPQSELSNYILTVSKFSLSTAIHNNEHNCKTRSKEEPTLLNVIYIYIKTLMISLNQVTTAMLNL